MRHTTIANLESLYHITNTGDGEGEGREGSRRRARARERAAELSLTISSFGLSEKFAGRRERSTAESVPDCNGNRPTDGREYVTRSSCADEEKGHGERERAGIPSAFFPRPPHGAGNRLILARRRAHARGRRLHNFSGLVGVICFRTRHGGARRTTVAEPLNKSMEKHFRKTFAEFPWYDCKKLRGGRSGRSMDRSGEQNRAPCN